MDTLTNKALESFGHTIKLSHKSNDGIEFTLFGILPFSNTFLSVVLFKKTEIYGARKNQ